MSEQADPDAWEREQKPVPPVVRLLTCNEYSDYSILGNFQFPSEQWLWQRLVDFRERYSTEPDGNNTSERFVDYLLACYPREFKDVGYSEVHLGNYGDLTWTGPEA